MHDQCCSRVFRSAPPGNAVPGHGPGRGRAPVRELRAAWPDARICYAVKANPAPEILRLLVRLGAEFDVASPAEIASVPRRRRRPCFAVLRQHHQEGVGHRVRARRWCSPVHHGQPSRTCARSPPTRPARTCSAGSWCSQRVRRRRSAASSAVIPRWRATSCATLRDSGCGRRGSRSTSVRSRSIRARGTRASRWPRGSARNSDCPR